MTSENSTPKGKRERFALWGLVALLICVALVTFRRVLSFPIFTDEIAFQLINARAFFDGFTHYTPFFCCPSGNSGFSTPLTLMPGLIINSLLYLPGESASALRFLGLIFFVGWYCSIVRLWRNADTGLSKYEFLLFSFTPLLGVLPLTLSFTRPEIVLGFGLTLLIAESIAAKSAVPSVRNSVRCFFIFFLLPSWMFVLHPKFGFWVPLVLFAGFSSLKTVRYRIAHVIWIVALTFQSGQHYRRYLDCADEPELTRKLNSLNLLTDSAVQHRSFFAIIEKAFSNIYWSTTRGFSDILVTKDSWTGLDRLWNAVPQFANLLAVIFLLLSCVLIFWGTVRGVCRTTLTYADRLSILSFGCLIVYLGFQSYYFYYYPGFLYLALAPSIVLFQSGRLPRSFRKLLQGSLFALAGVVTWSALSSSWAEEGQYKDLPWREVLPLSDVYSESSRGLKYNAKVTEFAGRCGILPVQSGKRAIVDEATFFAFRRTGNPIMSQYTWRLFYIPGPQSLEDLSRESFGGLLTRCERVPTEFLRVAEKQDELCCIPPSERRK